MQTAYRFRCRNGRPPPGRAARPSRGAGHRPAGALDRPGVVFDYAESGCLFADEPAHRTAYDPAWLASVWERFEVWREENTTAYSLSW
jgi:hypothetical protein